MANVLVLEDELSNLQVFAAILWSKGYTVLEATTAQQAFDAAARQQTLDLLVCDVSLKGESLSGTDVAVALTRNRANVPVLFVSGTPLRGWYDRDRGNLRRLLSTGVEILEKPFTLKSFDAAVDRLLAGTKPRVQPSIAETDREFSRA